MLSPQSRSGAQQSKGTAYDMVMWYESLVVVVMKCLLVLVYKCSTQLGIGGHLYIQPVISC